LPTVYCNGKELRPIIFCVLLRNRELVGEASTGGSRVRGAWRCGSAAAAPDRRRPTFTAEQKTV